MATFRRRYHQFVLSTPGRLDRLSSNRIQTSGYHFHHTSIVKPYVEVGSSRLYMASTITTNWHPLERLDRLVSCPDPTQLTQGEGSVSKVQILGLAPEAWRGQSNRRAAFIGVMRKREQVSIGPLQVML